MRKQRIELVVEAVHFLMKIVIVFFCSFNPLLELHLTSSQDVLFVPGFILLVHHVDQHELIVAICHSQPLDCKCLLISVVYHLLQLLLSRISRAVTSANSALNLSASVGSGRGSRGASW
jgi:hypothetical protein